MKNLFFKILIREKILTFESLNSNLIFTCLNFLIIIVTITSLNLIFFLYLNFFLC